MTALYDDVQPSYNPDLRADYVFPVSVIQAPTSRAKCQLCKRTISKGDLKLSASELDLHQVGGFAMSNRSVCKKCGVRLLSSLIKELKGDKEVQDIWNVKRKA